jgi:ABC-type sulfate transport system permease component
MFYWNPATSECQTWQPVGGWNALYSERDKIQAVALYTHLHARNYSSAVASTLVQMIISKQLYHGLHYSEEQERAIEKVLHYKK